MSVCRQPRVLVPLHGGLEGRDARWGRRGSVRAGALGPPPRRKLRADRHPPRHLVRGRHRTPQEQADAVLQRGSVTHRPTSPAHRFLPAVHPPLATAVLSSHLE